MRRYLAAGGADPPAQRVAERGAIGPFRVRITWALASRSARWPVCRNTAGAGHKGGAGLAARPLHRSGRLIRVAALRHVLGDARALEVVVLVVVVHRVRAAVPVVVAVVALAGRQGRAGRDDGRSQRGRADGE